MSILEIERMSASSTTAESLIGGKVHSTVAAAHVQWVRDYHGEDAVKELFRTLDPAVAAELTGNDVWMAFATLISVDRAIEQQFGRGRRAFLRELGRYSAYLNLAGLQLRGSDVHDFFRRAAQAHARFQDSGIIAWEELGPTAGRMTLDDADCYSPVWCASGIGYYEQALVMQHVSPMRVEETTCRCNGDERCTFELAWT